LTDRQRLRNSALLTLCALSSVGFSSCLGKPRKIPTSRDAVGIVTTVAGAGYPGVEDGRSRSASFSNPFGIAVDQKGNIIVADAGRCNCIRRISPEGAVQTIAGSTEGFADGEASSAAFNTPSGLALDSKGDIVIADTSNNRIRKLTAPSKSNPQALVKALVSTVAGSGRAGYLDGAGDQAQFDGPLAVAVAADGTIFVADTYNDRVRTIAADGFVRTLAGSGSPGFKDGQAEAAQFDTPSGIAVDEHGNVFVADTGNNAIRKVAPDGAVTTMAGGSRGRSDGVAQDARFDHPVGIAVTHDGFLFVADEGSGRIRRILPEGEVNTMAGYASGFADGTGKVARFNGPESLALGSKGEVYVADAENYLIRRIDPGPPDHGQSVTVENPERFIQPPKEGAASAQYAPIPELNAAHLGIGQYIPWPLNPQSEWHEVAGVVGEARGAAGGVALDHLHSGLDVRGAMGEPVLSVLDEKVAGPLAEWGFDETGEGMRVGVMSYIHVRIGRNARGQIEAPERFKPRLDEAGKIIGVRVRRGTRFNAGDFIGTVNKMYHVHLNLGPWNAQANPIHFPFPGFKDDIAPAIEPGGIEVLSSSGEPFKQVRGGPLVISGDVKIVVTAYDRVNGNAPGRKLGLYKAGYQILKEDRAPAAGFETPLINVSFDRLPADDNAVLLAYAPGSGVSAYGTPTKFRYIVTNLVRDGVAREGFLRTSLLAPGNYILKIIAEDAAGNRASGPSTEVAIRIE